MVARPKEVRIVEDYINANIDIDIGRNANTAFEVESWRIDKKDMITLRIGHSVNVHMTAEIARECMYPLLEKELFDETLKAQIERLETENAALQSRLDELSVDYDEPDICITDFVKV
jgi:hypothetical protein